MEQNYSESERKKSLIDDVFLADKEFLSASTSRLSNTNGCLRIASTPKGQRGFFYRRCLSGKAGFSRIKVFGWPYQLSL